MSITKVWNIQDAEKLLAEGGPDCEMLKSDMAWIIKCPDEQSKQAVLEPAPVVEEVKEPAPVVEEPAPVVEEVIEPSPEEQMEIISEEIAEEAEEEVPEKVAPIVRIKSTTKKDKS